jgi:hypothetical protein
MFLFKLGKPKRDRKRSARHKAALNKNTRRHNHVRA